MKVGDKLEFTYTQNETLRRRLPEGKKLIYHTFSLPIDHSTIAGYVAATGLELNIPTVGELSPDLPYKFGIEFDEAADYHTQSMFTLPLKTIRKDTVGVLQIINAQDEADEVVSFSDEDLLRIRHFATSAATALERAQMTRTFFLRMIRMTELRDPKETASHVIRVGAYSTELYEVWARAQGMAEKEIERQRDILRLAAMLHDVGKVGIVDRILKKPAPLTAEEYEIMQGHTLIGTQLFADPKSDFEEAAALVALNHHER